MLYWEELGAYKDCRFIVPPRLIHEFFNGSLSGVRGLHVVRAASVQVAMNFMIR